MADGAWLLHIATDALRFGRLVGACGAPRLSASARHIDLATGRHLAPGRDAVTAGGGRSHRPRFAGAQPLPLGRCAGGSSLWSRQSPDLAERASVGCAVLF